MPFIESIPNGELGSNTLPAWTIPADSCSSATPYGSLTAKGVSGSQGALYVSDTGDSTAAGRGAVFRLIPGRRPTLVPGSDTVQAQSSANGLFPGGGDTLYVVGYRTGVLSVTDGRGTWRELGRGLGSPDGIDDAGGGGLFVSRGLLVIPENSGNRLSIFSLRDYQKH